MGRNPTNTRERILDKATKLFSQQGYSATRVHDIAKSCDISQALIYYNFSSKEEILQEVMNRFKTRITKMFVEVFLPIGQSPAEGDWSSDELRKGMEVFTSHREEFAILIFESMKSISSVPPLYEFWEDINSEVRRNILQTRGYQLEKGNEQQSLVDFFFILIPTLMFSTMGQQWLAWEGFDNQVMTNRFTKILNEMYHSHLKN